MKKIILLFAFVMFVLSTATLLGQETFVDEATKDKVKSSLLSTKLSRTLNKEKWGLSPFYIDEGGESGNLRHSEPNIS